MVFKKNDPEKPTSFGWTSILIFVFVIIVVTLYFITGPFLHNKTKNGPSIPLEKEYTDGSGLNIDFETKSTLFIPLKEEYLESVKPLQKEYTENAVWNIETKNVSSMPLKE